MVVVSLLGLKMYLEVVLYIYPLGDRDDLNNWTKTGKSILFSIAKTVQLVETVALAKWFSRKWFPFFSSLWLLSNPIAYLLKYTLTCEETEAC